ncbi:MotA/TolQ/ExbB proton channel family protein [Sporomusa sphaeroides]|uniref:Colicin uptake protein TolQ n=2 Tax=Sporomusa TaxID=2375 RepID=A0ABP2C274_9FIRM|nr:MotA/TolQ/ExbB proton channel family protein [Sporomusa sphaeroides]OLS57127.1 biopolymer transport protein ExbB [Sporomusa sphaeroides DSM 2875]CVK18313.1 colicin uptake protein TolQ [Sporomusa sphaeroides DSM 2875]SCM81583.1 Biopolymer transport protein [uncultured Sporomusa sp.]
MSFIAECFHIFQQGGPVMYLLLACSLLAATIGVERFLYYRKMKADMHDFTERITPLLERADWTAAGELCRQTQGIAAMVAAKGIGHIQRGCANIESVLEGEASLAVAGLRANLNHLDTVVTIAPLLGLLGTVIGMISSFSVMNIKAGQPQAITGGVGEALIATATGLCVATVAMLLYSYFNHRLDDLITNIEKTCLLLLGYAKQEKCHEIA